MTSFTDLLQQYGGPVLPEQRLGGGGGLPEPSFGNAGLLPEPRWGNAGFLPETPPTIPAFLPEHLGTTGFLPEGLGGDWVGNLLTNINVGKSAAFQQAQELVKQAQDALTKPKPPAQGQGQGQGPGAAGAPAAPAGSASPSNYAFAQQHYPLAQQAVQQAGADLDPAIPVAVAANETQWGQAPQGGQPWNSFHGIRGTGTAGVTPGGFRANLTPLDSYNQFVALVTDPNSVYGPAYQQYQRDHNAAAFIENIGRAGYALAGPEADAWIPQVQGLMPQVLQQWQAPLPPGSVQPLPNAPLASGPYQAGGNPWQIAFDFNQPYSTPLSQGTAVHRGVDLTIPGAAQNGRGTPYQAFVPGVVTNLTEDPDGGHGIIVQSADGLYQRYFHNDRVLVQVGDPVGPGYGPIGIVGASGTEGFPHLHFEVSRKVNGDRPTELIDPRPYLQQAGVVQ